MKRISTLDGWRGLAIALVLFDHTQGGLSNGYLHSWTQTGQHGVTIFFVLSGFLITSKLMEGPIDLKRFFVRRFLRLMPVAWAYLIFVWVLELLTGQHWIPAREIVSCVFFYRNYMGLCRGIYAGHYWSLSLEEQFYLVWPCLLLLVGIRKARWFAVIGALACSTYRLMNWSRYSHQWVSFHTEVRADAILVGCVLAILLADPRFRPIATRWSRLAALPACAVLLYCMARFPWLPPLSECLAIATLIAASVLHPQSIFARSLSFKALAWLGTVSYSVYVWQEFFFAWRNSVPAELAGMCMMPLFALGSYYWIERPLTRLGHRITARPAEAEPMLEVANTNGAAAPPSSSSWGGAAQSSSVCAETL